MTEMIRELMIQSVGAFLAIFGFSLLVDMPRKYLVYAGITGGAGWLAYLVSMQVGTSQVAAAFFSSLAAALLSQVFARVLKAPVTIFLVAGILSRPDNLPRPASLPDVPTSLAAPPPIGRWNPPSVPPNNPCRGNTLRS